MSPHAQPSPQPPAAEPRGEYRPPTLAFLGTLAELTQKEVGASDGTEILGIQLGS